RGATIPTRGPSRGNTRLGEERDAGHASGSPSGRLVWGRLVQDQPVEAQLADRFGEFREVDRLTHVAVRAEAVAADEIALLLGRREDHHREQSGTRIGTQAAQHLEPVDARELEVEQDRKSTRL